MYFLIAFACGFLLDLIIGDPRWMYHPVRLIGALITLLEKIIRAVFPKTERGELIGGGILTALVLIVTPSCVIGILILAWIIHPALYYALQGWMFYQMIAVKALRDESMRVYDELSKHDLPAARKAVSMIVGRDTEQLTEVQVTKAAVETVAESTSDGIIAPLFFMIIGGAPLLWFYKAANTMDSMLGYKNDRYLFFGRAAAKFDDIVNYLPSRIAALFMIAAAYLVGLDGKNAAFIHRRDKRNHASPNSAQTESVAAGALNIQLAGNAMYFGKLYEKPTIGDPNRPIETEDIKRVNRLMSATAILCAATFAFIRLAIILLIR
ncbi:MAG: adenosylcobinamide-phosphate synthase CbiB [Anaerofustis sp.]